MYSEEDIASAVSAGAISEEAAAALRAHVQSLRHAPVVDDEHFRLITGFNDIFVVIACVLVLASAGWIGAQWQAWLGWAAVAAVAWPLAEFFTRRRRMALPSILLLLAFAGGVFNAAFVLLKPEQEFHGTTAALVSAAAGLLTAAAAWMHWRRFQVPITVAAGTAASVICVFALVTAAMPEAELPALALLLASGVAVFFLALRWDAADPLRQTRKSDVAFWLHLLAAVLIVHPFFALIGITGSEPGPVHAALVIMLYILIALVSVAIDRRAMMVSALAYVLYTFSALLERYGVVSMNFALTALFIGAALLLLSAFWHPVRAAVVGRLPAGWAARLAPLR